MRSTCGKPGLIPWMGCPAHSSFRVQFFVGSTNAHEFGELITRFLKIVFLSITLVAEGGLEPGGTLGLPNGPLRYLQTFQARTANPSASATSASALMVIAALWERREIFSNDGLRSMRLVLPHLDHAFGYGVRQEEAGFRAGRMSDALDCLTLGVVLVNRSERHPLAQSRAQECGRFQFLPGSRRPDLLGVPQPTCT